MLCDTIAPVPDWRPLRRKADFYVLAFEGRARAADDFASPEFFAQENQGTVVESADGAE